MADGSFKSTERVKAGDLVLSPDEHTRLASAQRVPHSALAQAAGSHHLAGREDGSLAGRCRMHGGLSTGPKTKQGRAARAQSNRRRAAQVNAS
jgi:hypothetical protein